MEKKTGFFTEKNIRDFMVGDKIGIKKIIGGHQMMFICSFVSFSKGIVNAKKIYCETSWAMRDSEIGDAFSGRLKNCFLIENNGQCHWFNKEGFAK